MNSDATTVIQEMIPVISGNSLSWWEKLVSRYRLRKADKVGKHVQVNGKLSVENKGELVIGDSVSMHSKIAKSRLAVQAGAKMIIGNHCYINGAIIAATNQVIIGNGCELGPFSHIMDGDFHGLKDRTAEGLSAPVILEDGVKLGARSMVLKGVRIGKGAMVMPGAVVTKDVPAFTTVSGVPARIIPTS